jgi:hypothetical protein
LESVISPWSAAGGLVSRAPQRRQPLQIVTAAEAKGQARVAEMNKQVAANLARIIAALDTDHSGEAAGDAH